MGVDGVLLVSLIVIEPLETIEVPPSVVLIDAINVSATVSVLASANGVTVNVPVPSLPMSTYPVPAAKSAALDKDQYSRVLAATLVVVTIKDIGEPSLTEVALPAAATAYVGVAGGVVLESPIQIAAVPLLLVLTILTAPDTLPSRISNLNASLPSVNASALAVRVIVVIPLDAMVTEPSNVLSVKSEAVILPMYARVVQYTTVPGVPPVVFNVNVTVPPRTSLIYQLRLLSLVTPTNEV